MKTFEIEEVLANPSILDGLSLEELERLRDIFEAEEDSKNTDQMAYKILINALYGALANKHFALANPDLAAGITSTGRFFVSLLANRIEERLQALIPDPDNTYICYGDTDSIFPNDKIIVNGNEIEIEKYFNNAKSEIVVTKSGNEVKKIENDTTLTYNNQLITKPIKYVMGHKVKKEMFEIKVNGNKTTITKDHSLMVMRNDELISIKPKDVKKGDKLVYIKKLK